MVWPFVFHDHSFYSGNCFLNPFMMLRICPIVTFLSFSGGLEQDPFFAKVLGDNSLREGDYSSAIRYYSFAINLDSTGRAAAVCFANRASALCHLRDFGAAILDCEVASALQPRYSKAHLRLGFASYCAADYGRAVKALTYALYLDPTSAITRKYLILAQERCVSSQVKTGLLSFSYLRTELSTYTCESCCSESALKGAAFLLDGLEVHVLPPTEAVVEHRLNAFSLAMEIGLS